MRNRIVLLALVVLAAVPPSAEATYPGREGRIAFAPGNFDRGHRSIFTVTPTGRDRRVLVPDGIHARWSADGRVLAYTTDTGTFVANADGSNARRVSGDREPFALSPDGRTIVVSRVTEPDPELTVPPDLIAIDLATGAERVVTRDGSRPVYSPGGRWIAFVDQAQGRAHRTVSRVKTTGGSRGPVYTAPDTVESLDWSPDGKSLAFVHRNGAATNLRLLSLNPRRSRVLFARGSAGGLFGGLSWSPTGRRLVVSGWDGRAYYDLLSVEVSRRRVTRLGPKGQFPAWRPLR